MKSILTLLVSGVLFTGCHSSDSKDTGTSPGQKDPFIGTFVRDSTDAMGTMHDTLEITQTGLTLKGTKSSPLYTVIHKTGDIQVRDGIEQPQQNKQVYWTGHYNEEEACLDIENTQEKYVRSQDGKGINNGRLYYYRLNSHH